MAALCVCLTESLIWSLCVHTCAFCMCVVLPRCRGRLKMRIFKRREKKVARGEEIWVLSSLFTRV